MEDDWPGGAMPGGRRPGSRPLIPLERGRVLLVVSGAIGAYSMPEWALRLRVECGWSIRVCVTRAAADLVSTAALAVASQAPVDGPDWDVSRGTVPHLDLAEWPDLVLVAPATMNFIAKCAAGMADSLALTAVLCTRAPVLLAPSVPEAAQGRASVQRNLRLLEEDGFHVVPGQTGYSAHAGRRVAQGMPGLPAVLRHAERVFAKDLAERVNASVKAVD